MPSKIITKINELDRKLDVVEEIEEHLEKLVEKEDKEIKKVEKEELKIEEKLLKIGKFTITRNHLLELARGVAGAFLGVGLGQAVVNSVKTAAILPWLNTIGILVFILILVGILIYKHDKDDLIGHKNVYWYLFKKLAVLYMIALMVEIFGLVLFNNFPGWNETLLKALVIGSYSAMSSAVAFTLI